MIKHIFTLPKYNWTVIACYGANEKESYRMLDFISELGSTQLQELEEVIKDGMEDNGFTYTKYSKRISIVVIGYGSSNEEFMNTLVHEARHLEQHICKYYEIDEESEEHNYLIGKLVQTMYQVFKYLLD